MPSSESPARDHRKRVSVVLTGLLVAGVTWIAMAVGLYSRSSEGPTLGLAAWVVIFGLVLLSVLGWLSYRYLRATHRLKELVEFIDEAEPHAYLERIPRVGRFGVLK